MRKKGPFKSAASSALPRLLPLPPSLHPGAPLHRQKCWVVEDILAWLACAKTKQNSSK